MWNTKMYLGCVGKTLNCYRVKTGRYLCYTLGFDGLNPGLAIILIQQLLQQSVT
jgi:hypothetical protein